MKKKGLSEKILDYELMEIITNPMTREHNRISAIQEANRVLGRTNAQLQLKSDSDTEKARLINDMRKQVNSMSRSELNEVLISLLK